MSLIEKFVSRIRRPACPGCFVVGVVALNVAIVALAVLTLQETRALHEARAEQDTRNLALVLEKELASVLGLADASLRTVIDEYERQDRSGGVDVVRLRSAIQRQQQRYPQIDAVRITDRHGRLRYGSDIEEAVAPDLSDRPHFRTLASQNTDRLEVSRAQKSRVNGKWVIVLARRVSARDGSFLGMAFVPVTVDYLTRTLSQVQLPASGSITLRYDDLGLIARYPAPADIEGVIGQSRVGRAFTDLLASGATTGTFRAVTPLDQVERVLSYRKVDDYPLYLIVGLARTQYLEAWIRSRDTATKVLAVFVLLTITLSLLTWSASRHLADANRALEKLASVDPLTELLNRRAFADEAGPEVARARRYDKPLALMMLDIDYFKKVNDEYGHGVGDRVLQALAGILRETTRTFDLIARWGGEEFIVLLPETTKQGALELAERIRQGVESSSIEVGQAAPIRITVSIGVAAFESADDDFDHVVSRADSLLYEAKHRSRNCVCS